jgi:MORN repeat variant
MKPQPWCLILALCLCGMLACSRPADDRPTFEIPVVWNDTLPKEISATPIAGTNRSIIRVHDRLGNLWGYFFADGDVAHGPASLFYTQGGIYRAATFVHGLADGEMKTFWANGNLRWIHPMKLGMQDGIQYFFDSTGQKYSAVTFLADQREGLGTWYYPSGTVKQEGMYHLDQPVGKHFGYDPQGRLIDFRYFGRHCLNPPCGDYGISLDSLGMPTDSFRGGPSENQDMFYAIIRRDTFKPSSSAGTAHLGHLLPPN